MQREIASSWPYVVGFQFFLLVAFGITRFAWRYVSLSEVKTILVAMGTGAAFLLAARFVSATVMPRFVYAQYALVPVGVILIDFFLGFLGVTGVRVLRRVSADRLSLAKRRADPGSRIPTLLVGAGHGGAMVAREIARHPELGIYSEGFLDDDEAKVGTVIHGVPVLGTIGQLVDVCGRRKAAQVLITIPGDPTVIRRTTRLCEEAGVPAKIIPDLHEIVSGKADLSGIRSVEIEDLLGRQPVMLDEDEIAKVVKGEVVLITGAGGSIGSELCRQVCRFGAAKLVLVERFENGLFRLHGQLRDTLPDFATVPCVADIRDRGRMMRILEEHRPSVLLHAAAHKHVPMMEMNPQEAIRNNVFGTQRLADAARDAGVGTFVMISTDKAVNPTSVMGVTKRIAEIYVQALSQNGPTRFITVRFGNVLGSAGSVIPTFREQIAKGGPVTVTHADMKRYFMTISEACQLVLQAASMGKGGEIFILDMGELHRIEDLARDLIRLSGFRPGEDIQIVYSGIRPGEKLYEELSVTEEAALKTHHPKIFIGRLRSRELGEVQRQMEMLRQRLEEGDFARIRSTLQEMVPEYRSEDACGG